MDDESIHPLWLRLMHWANAFAVIILIMSGWRIYNATRFLHLSIPGPHGDIALFPNGWTLGGWLGGALQWHFAAMWILFVNALLYAGVSIATRRFSRQFLPVGPRSLWADVVAFVKGRLSHADIRHYNAIQKLAYLFAMADIVVLICSGLVLWKSVQFPVLRTLLGGYEGARLVHFLAMTAMLFFVLVHVVMAALVPRTIRAMVWGR